MSTCLAVELPWPPFFNFLLKAFHFSPRVAFWGRGGNLSPSCPVCQVGAFAGKSDGGQIFATVTFDDTIEETGNSGWAANPPPPSQLTCSMRALDTFIRANVSNV